MRVMMRAGNLVDGDAEERAAANAVRESIVIWRFARVMEDSMI